MNKYVLGFSLTVLIGQKSNAEVTPASTVKKDIAIALYTAALTIQDQHVKNDLWDIVSSYIKSNQTDCLFEKIAEEITQALESSLIEELEQKTEIEAFIGTVSDKLAVIDDATFLADITSFAECTLKNGGVLDSCKSSTTLFQ